MNVTIDGIDIGGVVGKAFDGGISSCFNYAPINAVNKETKKGRKRFRYNFAPLLNEGSCGRCIRETAKLVQEFGCQSFPLHSQQKRDNLGEG